MASKLKPKVKLPSQIARCQAAVCKAKLSDIAPAFNLIQEYSRDGSFNNIYLSPRYQAGLALQLFSVWLLGKIRLPSGIWYKANLQVIRHEGAFAGFVLMRHLVPSGGSQEIYMCAVESRHRGNGFGRQLIQSVLDNLESNSIIETECSPQSVYMIRLLNHMGFKSINCGKTAPLNKYCLKI